MKKTTDHWVDRDRQIYWKRITPDRLKDDDPRLGRALETLKSDKPVFTKALNIWRGETNELTESRRSTDLELQIEQICWRHLNFYKEKTGKEPRQQPILIELLVRSHSSFQPDPKFDRLYFVARAGDAPLLHLDGSSYPIHELNRAEGEIDSKQAENYCEFFCAFVADENGNPFTIVQQDDKFSWAQWPDETKFFEAVRLGEVLRDDERAVADLGEIDRFGKLKRFVETTVQNFGGFRSPTAEVISSLVRSSKTNNGDQTIRELQETVSKTQGSSIGIFAVLIRFGRGLFHSVMAVKSNGAVEMLWDLKLHSVINAYPIGQMSFSDRLGLQPYRTLVEVPAPTMEIDIVQKLERIRRLPQVASAPFAKPLEPATELRSVKIPDGVLDETLDHFVGHSLELPINFQGVDFFGEINFENTTFLGTVRFVNCRFLRRLNLRNSKFLSGLIFDQCLVSGIPERRGPTDSAGHSAEKATVQQLSELLKCLDLDGAFVGGDLEFLQCSFEGSMSMRRATIQGRTRFEGSDFAPLSVQVPDGTGRHQLRREFKLMESPGHAVVSLDLRHSKFDRGLTISAHFPQTTSGQYGLAKSRTLRPALLVGCLRGDHAKIDGGLVINGLVTCTLNPKTFNIWGFGWTYVSFMHARISGGVQMWSAGEDALSLWHVAPTVISGDLILSEAEIEGNCDLRSLCIKGDLTAIGLRSSGDLLLNCLSQRQIDDWPDQFPSWSIDRIGNDRLSYEVPNDALYEDDGNIRLAKFCRTRVAGKLDLTAAKLSTINISGAHICKGVICHRGEYGEIIAGISLSPIDSAASSSSAADLIRLSRKDGSSKFEYLLDYLRRNADTIHFEPHTAGKKGLLVLRTRASRLELRDSTVHGPVRLAGLWLAEEDDGSNIGEMSADEFAPPQSARSSIRTWSKQFEQDRVHQAVPYQLPASVNTHRLTIENVVIDGPILLYDHQFCGEFVDRLDEHEVSHYVSLFDMDTRPDRSAVCSKLREILSPGFDCTWIVGAMRIANSDIQGTLDVSGLTVEGQVEIRDVSLDSDLVAGTWRESDFSSGSPSALHAVVGSLDLEMLRCDGDIQLAGLITPGDLSGRNLVSKGHFDLLHLPDENSASRYDPLTAGERPSGFRACHVGGRVVFTGADINWMRAVTTPSHAGNQWTLERSKIGRLDFWAPLPGKIQLRGLDCQEINLPGGNDDRDWRNELLEASSLSVPPMVPTESAALFERMLRKQGRMSEANYVQAQILGRVRGFFFMVLANTWGAMTLFGFGMILIAAAYFLVTAEEDNWTVPPLALIKSNPEMERPRINTTQSATKAVEIALPITLTTKDSISEPTLREAGSTIAYNRSLLLSGPPTLWAFVITVLGWIIWPLFVLAISGFARRE